MTKKLPIVLAVLGTVVFGAVGAQAQTQIAEFDGANLQFSKIGSNWDLTTPGQERELVNFQFDVANSYNNEQFENIAAWLTVTAVTGTATQQNEFGTKFDGAPVTALNFQFTAVNAVNGKTDLLSLTSGTGELSGPNKGTNAALMGDSSEGDNVSFSSDFLTWNGIVTQSSYNIALGLSNTQYTESSGHINPFAATGQGDFSTTPAPIPEGSTLVTFAIMSLGFVGLAFRARRATANNA